MSLSDVTEHDNGQVGVVRETLPNQRVDDVSVNAIIQEGQIQTKEIYKMLTHTYSSVQKGIYDKSL